MEVCSYCHVRPGIYLITRKRKPCCQPRYQMCPIMREKQRMIQSTIDKTGTSPIQRMVIAKQTRIDPETGLTKMKANILKMNAALDAPKKNGMTRRQELEIERSIKDSSGLSRKQKAAQKGVEKIQANGTRTEIVSKILKTKKLRASMDPNFQSKINEKSMKTRMTKIGHDGLTTSQRMSKLSSKRMKSINPRTGKTYSKTARDAAITKGKGVRYSKESTKFFSELNKIYPDLDMLYGKRGEYVIVDPETKRPFFFDLYIKQLGLIVEYHGSRWHPNRALMTQEEWNLWKSPGGMTANDVERNDLHKKWLASERGFTFFVIWSNSREEDLKMLCGFIEHLQSSFDGTGNLPHGPDPFQDLVCRNHRFALTAHEDVDGHVSSLDPEMP